MSFDDIPEDYEMTYPCGLCDGGNVQLDEDELEWRCDSCGYVYGYAEGHHQDTETS